MIQDIIKRKIANACNNVVHSIMVIIQAKHVKHEMIHAKLELAPPPVNV